MPHSSLTHTASQADSPTRWSVQPDAVTAPSLDELTSSSADIHMRFVAELEDAHWQTQLAAQSFYVAGRGYDQYQSALALGWNGALQNPDATFEDFSALLEAQWPDRRGSSLLPWREVHVAVKEAWRHARLQMQTLQVLEPATLCDRDVLVLLEPLHRECLTTAAQLEKLGAMPLSDFVKQIIDRHVQLMQSLAQGLYALGTPYDALGHSVQPWVRKFHRHWQSLKLRFIDTSPEDFLLLCEQRERNLLCAYQATLDKQLPKTAKNVLQRQTKQLENHVEKLSWVRNNWAIQ